MLAGHPHHGQGAEDVGEHHKKSPPGFSPGGLSGNRGKAEGERGGFVEQIHFEARSLFSRLFCNSLLSLQVI